MTASVNPRVLIMVTSSSTVSAFLPPIVAALQRANATVSVAAAPGKEPIDLGSVQFHALPFERSSNPVAAVRAAWQTLRLIRRMRPDMVVCATPVASLLGVSMGRLCGIPAVVHLAWGLRSESLKGLAGLLVRAGERATVRLAHLTIANSPSLADVIIASTPRVSGKVECLGHGSSHGVDTIRFSYVPPKLSRDVPNVGFVGRIREDKGVLELLDAVEELRQRDVPMKLVMAGPIEDERIASRLVGLEGVHHEGDVRDVPAFMASLDILVLPTWREGFPNVVLEASATGRPVITTRATGAVDSVQDEETGLLVPPRDGVALAKAIEILLSDGDLRLRMGLNGRSWVENHFDSMRVSDRLARRLMVEVSSRG